VNNILLIDDNQDQLNGLEKGLAGVLKKDEAEIRLWFPEAEAGKMPQEQFEQLIDEDTVLVVTDYDLTKGQTGLLGSAVVQWCQLRFLPVGNFSKGHKTALPSEPDFYEIRIPTDDGAAAYISGIYRGFLQLRGALQASAEALKRKRSPAGHLATVLGRPAEESRFAMYGGRVGAVSGALLEKLQAVGKHTDTADVSRLLRYVLGHLLLNGILRFPGPIISKRALAAYLAIAESEIPKVDSVFVNAKYAGPFSEVEPYYWLSDVDEKLQALQVEIQDELKTVKAETHGELYREAVERSLKQKFTRPACPRCNGTNGGFLCPLTDRTVCQLPTCSVGSSSWIPAGARLCRIEKDFYEEWAPVLGF
jgi:hypothetical protein